MVALKTSLQGKLSSPSSQTQSTSGRAAARITLPDGSVREFDHPTTAKEVASVIGPGLARAAVAAMVEGKVVDINAPLKGQVNLRILTSKDPEGLEVVRHSTAHLMAYAVQELFPHARVTIGPVINDGFYYDFAVPHHFTPEDLQRIEVRMKELAQEDHPVSREVWERDQAIEYFRQVKEPYKVELISAIPQNEVISFYRMGEFLDLCRGPHVPSCGHLKVFKLMKVAGAYWRGDHRNEMLQRIYGTAWATAEEQQTYLHSLEEAEKRDHRRLGRQLNLFHLYEEAPGMVFWHPQGYHLWRSIESYMRNRLLKEGYQEVRTPMMMDRSLWERSGHWAMFGENMYTTESESRHFAVKPMNCPGHVLIYNSDVHSYRDLPLRMAEFGSCHRNEPSGSLHGLMRVRAFVQDDAHIFCTSDQVQSESAAFMKLLQSIYADFGFSEIEVRLSTRPAKRMGTDETWDKAENALAQALKQQNLSYKLQPGEGAFYGPKVEFSLKDSLGRLWQCGTLQLDFVLPDRLGAEYVGEDNNRHTPVMLHRAILGSLERFIGILIEHYGGAFPLWLAPVQVVVMNISEGQADYAKKIVRTLEDQGFRVTADLRSEKITYKIREHALAKRPYLVIVGDKEKEEGRVSIRARSDVDLNNLIAVPRKDHNEANMVAPEALIEHLQRQVLELCRGNNRRVASSN